MAEAGPFLLAEPRMRTNPFSLETDWLSNAVEIITDTRITEITADTQLLATFYNALPQIFCLLKKQIEDEYDGGTIQFHVNPAVRAMDQLLDAAYQSRVLLRTLLNEQASSLDESTFKYASEADEMSTISNGGLSAHPSDVALIVSAVEETLHVLKHDAGWGDSVESEQLTSALVKELEQLREAGGATPPLITAACTSVAPAPRRLPSMVQFHAAVAAAERAAATATLSHHSHGGAFRLGTGAGFGSVHATCSRAASDARIVLLGIDVGGAEAVAAGRRLLATFADGTFPKCALEELRGLLCVYKVKSASALTQFFDIHASAYDSTLPLYWTLEHLSSFWTTTFESELWCTLDALEQQVALAATAGDTAAADTAAAAAGKAHTRQRSDPQARAVMGTEYSNPVSLSEQSRVSCCDTGSYPQADVAGVAASCAYAGRDSHFLYSSVAEATIPAASASEMSTNQNSGTITRFMRILADDMRNNNKHFQEIAARGALNVENVKILRHITHVHDLLHVVCEILTSIDDMQAGILCEKDGPGISLDDSSIMRNAEDDGAFNIAAQRIVEIEGTVRDLMVAVGREYQGTRNGAKPMTYLSRIVHAALELCWGRARVCLTHRGSMTITGYEPVG
jgi:hypothetical protein